MTCGGVGGELLDDLLQLPWFALIVIFRKLERACLCALLVQFTQVAVSGVIRLVDQCVLVPDDAVDLPVFRVFLIAVVLFVGCHILVGYVCCAWQVWKGEMGWRCRRRSCCLFTRTLKEVWLLLTAVVNACDCFA